MTMLQVVLVLLVGWCAAAPAPVRVPAQPCGDNNSNPYGDFNEKEERSFHPEPDGGNGGGAPPSTPRPPTPRPPTFRPSTPQSSTPRPFTPRPTTPRPSTPRPTTPRPPTHRPVTHRPPTPGPSFPGSSSSISPYFADPQGRPAPSPPMLGQELMPQPRPCPHSTVCDPATPYRTFSGFCNNQQHPELGAAGDSFNTLVPQIYDEPAVYRTKSARGGLLPNPRQVSLFMRNTPEGNKEPVNSFFVNMGQFLDHDLSITSFFGSDGNSNLSCRPCSSWVNPPCVPIPVPFNDPYMPPFTPGSSQPRCLPLARSVGTLVRDAQGRRSLVQLNLNNAFLDMSQIYGSDPCTADSLRSHRDGMLKSDPNHILLRQPAGKFQRCRTDDGRCFVSGDKRVNENMGQTLCHVVFHRAHNLLAEALKDINPHWDDERLFQEARRINIASLQNFVYKEYLPTLVGYHTAAKRRLIPHHEGYFLDYNPAINPAVYNGFTTAAFRMGHSQVPKFFFMLDEHYQFINYVPLIQTFFNTSLVAQSGTFDPLIRGLLGVPLQPTDLNLIEDLNNKLFIKKDDPLSGHDLFAINIARGRDHGLAPYVRYLSTCGIKEVTSFSDLHSLMHRRTVDLLSRVYADLEDIDLFVGGLSERPMAGALVGPTFSCIITAQFTAAKNGDRFWFESPGAGFTLDQLQTLRQSTFASVLCQSMDHPDPVVPAQAFYLPNKQSNPMRRCSELPKINLELWREDQFHHPVPCRHLGVSYQVGRPVPMSPCLVCVCQKDGEVWCRCNLSGCTRAPHDYHCRRICGHTAPKPASQYPL